MARIRAGQAAERSTWTMKTNASHGLAPLPGTRPCESALLRRFRWLNGLLC